MWVGHRGWPHCYPENSLAGVRAALQRGAAAVEVDIQLTADAEPVLLHDAEIDRVSDQRASVLQQSYTNIRAFSVHEPSRFGDRFRPTTVAHLSELLALMRQFPGCRVFIEIKTEIFERFSRQQALDAVVRCLEQSDVPLFIISYDLYFLRLVQSQYAYPVGWVLTHYNQASLARIAQGPVDVVICNIRKIPPTAASLWQGPWQWFMYDIVNHQDQLLCEQWGVRWLETWDIGSMLTEQPLG